MIMKFLLVLVVTLLTWAALIFAVDVLVMAQAPPMAQPTAAPEVQNLLTQLHQVGCNAEENAAAQTIAQLQKENTDLKAKLQKYDPPKSGATKH